MLVEAEQTCIEREAHELGAAVPVEFLVDVRAVGFDRAQARAEELRDLGVGVAEREQPEDVGLLRRQSADRRAGALVGRARRERDADRRLRGRARRGRRCGCRRKVGLGRRLQHVAVGTGREHRLHGRQVVEHGERDDRGVGERARSRG